MWFSESLVREHAEISYFLLFDSKRNPVCFRDSRGLVLAKSTRRKELLKTSCLPIILALRATIGFKKLQSNKSCEGLILQLGQSKLNPRESDATDLFSHSRLLLTRRVTACLLGTPYQRTGIEAVIHDEEYNCLTALGSAKKRWSKRPELSDIRFIPQNHGYDKTQQFYLVPVCQTHIERKLQNTCHNLLGRNMTGRNPHAKTGLAEASMIESSNSLALYLSSRIPWRHPDISYIGLGKTKAHKPPGLLKAGKKHDYLGWDRYFAQTIPQDLKSLHHQAIRFTRSPKRGPCIVATARNEAIYLPHWCAYHLALGFEHIYIYTNDNNDKTLEVAKRISALTGQITVIDNRIKDQATRPQFKAYKHALFGETFVLDHDWCAIIDMDEYIAIKNTGDKIVSIRDFIEKVSTSSFMSPDIIVLNWIFAGFGGAMLPSSLRDSCSLPSRINSILSRNSHIKSIFRPQKFIASGCHYPLESPNCITSSVDSSGNCYSPYHTSLEPGIAPKPVIKGAAIIHYHHKTFEEFIWKTSRNLADRPHSTEEVTDIQRLEGFASHFRSAEEHYDKATSWLDTLNRQPAFTNKFNCLMTDATLGELLLISKDIMRKRANLVARQLVEDCSNISKQLIDLLCIFIDEDKEGKPKTD